MSRRKKAADAPGRYRLRITHDAQAVRETLRGDSVDAFEKLRTALKAQACKAAGYRLLARDGTWSEYCCVHLDRDWQVILTFDHDGGQIVHIGRHDGPEFYAALSTEYDIRDTGQRREQKPDCCGDDGWPSVGSSRAEKRAKRKAGVQRARSAAPERRRSSD